MKTHHLPDALRCGLSKAVHICVISGRHDRPLINTLWYTHINFQGETVPMVDLILNVPVNNFSAMLGRSHRFLGITSTFGE